MGFVIKDPDKGNQLTYRDPITGIEFHGYYLRNIVIQVRAHRIANNLPAGPNLAWEIQQILCANHQDDGICREVDDQGKTINVVTKIKNFAKSTATWVGAGMPLVDEPTFTHRQEVCLACPNFRNWFDKQKGIGSCSKCGCAVGRISIKLHWQTEKCPENRW